MRQHRYEVASAEANAKARLVKLREQVALEVASIARLREALKDFKPTDKSGWTYYDYAHFQGTSKADIHSAIYNAESRLRALKEEINYWERVIRDGDPSEWLDY